MKTTNLILAGLMTLSTYAQASWINVDAEVNVDATGRESEDYEAAMKMDATLKFELVLKEGIKAVLKARIEQNLYQNEDWQDLQDVEVEKMLEEAYISINTGANGLPQATITLGKHVMAFGQELLETPMYRDDLLFSVSSEREVVGITVELPTSFLKIVDSIAVSYFETTPGDLEIGEGRGYSVRLSKKVTSQIQAQVSALVKENDLFLGEDERRLSFGFVFASEDGSVKIWANGLAVENTVPYLSSFLVTANGAQVGASVAMGMGTLVVDYQTMENFAKELTVAYNIPVGSFLVISPEVRRTETQFLPMLFPQVEDTRIGIRARIDVAQAAKKALRKN